MDQLYPLLGIALPSTRPYVVMGHLLHSGASWRLERFSGRVGASDLAGRLEVDTAGQRPTLEADVRAKVLDLADLGPVIGARPANSGAATGHVLPDLPFQTERWRSVDADVRLRAKTLKRAKALPLDDLETHLRLRDAVLTLEPLNFSMAGGATPCADYPGWAAKPDPGARQGAGQKNSDGQAVAHRRSEQEQHRRDQR